MGAAGVGKTALIQQLLYDRFEHRHRRTVEEVYCLEPDPELLRLRLEIMDTSGSYSFPAMQKLRIQQGDAFALVFSLADLESFQEVERLRQEILRIKGENDVPIVVVGNQTDRFPGLEWGDRAAVGGAGCRHRRAGVGLRLRGDLSQGQPQSAGRV
ncbi:unnamed protein product [Staurois parvus]|uniref:Small monomeric GTPase n=1 Tax=Staurois parvus TaxID=386267 RepID=A0ABN9FRM4_9NEOB|nr:unnamed protein product [Staurois parvus]